MMKKSSLKFVCSILMVIAFCASQSTARDSTAFNFWDPTIFINAPATVSASGLYTDAAAKTLAAGIYPYDINVGRWNSGVTNERFIVIPNGTQLKYYNHTGFLYPTNTTFIQNYFYETTAGDPSTKRIFETRFFVYGGLDSDQGWYGFTYKWNQDQTDGNLVGVYTGLDTVFNITTAAGTEQLQWRYFTMNECMECHLDRKVDFTSFPKDTLDMKQVLSFVPPQLNMVSEKTNNENQLAWFTSDGLIAAEGMPEITEFFSWAAIDNEAEDLQHRVQSYYAVNCGHCHNPNGLQQGVYGTHIMQFFLESDTMNYINKKMTQPYFPDDTVGIGADGNPIMRKHFGYGIHGGHPDSSVFHLIMERLVMPKFGYYKVDTVAMAIIDEWIATVPEVSVERPVSRSPKRQAVIRNQMLQLSHFNPESDVNLYNLQGRPVSLTRIKDDLYFVGNDAVPGVYILVTEKESFRIYNPPAL